MCKQSKVTLTLTLTLTPTLTPTLSLTLTRTRTQTLTVPPTRQVVFIGRHLDREALTAGFALCSAKPDEL